MEIHFLNYSLVKIQKQHLELLRNWRNNEVREFMIYQDYITENMQQEWFENINNHHNFYFLISKKNTPVGLIDIKNVNWSDNIAETGIYIANPEFRLSDVSSIATVMSAAFIAKILHLKSIYGKVLSSNKQAIAFNVSTGFKITKQEDNVATMTIESIKAAFLEIIKLKEKLCEIHKKETNTDVKLLIKSTSLKEDKTLNWLIENKIKKYCPKFQLDEELLLL